MFFKLFVYLCKKKGKCSIVEPKFGYSLWFVLDIFEMRWCVNCNEIAVME